ncbi:unnamed protein product [Blepharisma stoltei]|uniref:Uncharacterized protein n=1 Tax=Blepharisma stoltei TaxID=1481888 RepID=A0AAU9IUD2_9CILI|nr:unnamed protein product [Blepharisma stoltei]
MEVQENIEPYSFSKRNIKISLKSKEKVIKSNDGNAWLQNIRMQQKPHEKFGFYIFQNVASHYVDFLLNQGCVLALFYNSHKIFLVTITAIEIWDASNYDEWTSSIKNQAGKGFIKVKRLYKYIKNRKNLSEKNQREMVSCN